MEREIKTDLTTVAEALPRLTEKQRAEMIGWLNGYVAGVDATRMQKEG